MGKSSFIDFGFEEIRQLRNNESIKEGSFLNDDIGMVISDVFKNVLYKLVHSNQVYRFKEGRILYVIQGEVRFSVNLIEHKAQQGDILIMPNNSLVEIIESSEDYDGQAIGIDPAFQPESLSNVLSESYNRNGILIPLLPEEEQRVRTYFTLLWQTVHIIPYRRDTVKSLLNALLHDLRYLNEQNKAAHSTHLSRKEELFHRFIRLVNKHSRKERNVQFYADQLYLTPHYLSNVIQQVSGQTVMQWINQAITLEAKVLLKHSDLMMYQIADELNFPNPSFFSKFFKRMTGMTPAEYQRSK